MHRFRSFWVSGIFALLSVLLLSPSCKLSDKDSPNIQYEVLSPWGEADPKILKGISARLDNLSGKKIGLFANYKRAAIPIAISLKAKLESRFMGSFLCHKRTDTGSDPYQLQLGRSQSG